MLGTIFILCTVSLAFVFFLLLLKLHLFSLCISSVSVYCLYTYLFSLMEMLQFNIVYRGLLKHLCKWAFVVDQLLVVAFFLPQSACAETVSLEKPRQNIQIV